MFEFIEVFYNRQRGQTGLGHLTPAEYADKWRSNYGEPSHKQLRVQDPGSRPFSHSSQSSWKMPKERAAGGADVGSVGGALRGSILLVGDGASVNTAASEKGNCGGGQVKPLHAQRQKANAARSA